MPFETDFYGLPVSTTSRKVLVFLLDVVMSNPNGDPANGGAPRMDPVSQRGYINHTALKRKARDYMQMVRDDVHYYSKGNNLTELRKNKTAKELCDLYPDLRLFGGGVGSGSPIKGPWLVTNARSIDKIDPMIIQGTCIADQVRRRKNTDGEDESYMGANFPSRVVVPYGLYKFTAKFNPALGKLSGITSDDMALFNEAVLQCWEHTRSTARPEVNLRRAYFFDFESQRGTVPEHVLESMINITSDGEPESFDDYDIDLDLSRLPDNVRFFAWEDGIVAGRDALAAK